MRLRIAVVFVAVVFVLVAILYAQEHKGKTRSAAPEAIPATSPYYPAIGIDIDQNFTWSELLALVTLLSIIIGCIQWLITRAIVQPQIEKSFKLLKQEITAESLAQFTSKYAFGLHEAVDQANHQALNESMEKIVMQQDVENERLTDARERIRVLESRRS